jgi:hypothetical protein
MEREETVVRGGGVVTRSWRNSRKGQEVTVEVEFIS